MGDVHWLNLSEPAEQNATSWKENAWIREWGHRGGPCPIFQSVAVDFFRPIEYQGTVCLHSHLGSACGIHGHILNRQLPPGHAEIYVLKRNTYKNPV